MNRPVRSWQAFAHGTSSLAEVSERDWHVFPKTAVVAMRHAPTFAGCGMVNRSGCGGSAPGWGSSPSPR